MDIDQDEITRYEASIEKCEQEIIEMRSLYKNYESILESIKTKLFELENERMELYLKIKNEMKKKKYLNVFTKTDMQIMNEMINYYSFVTGETDPNVYCNRMGIIPNAFSKHQSDANYYPKLSGYVRFVIKQYVGLKKIVKHVQITEQDSSLDFFKIYREMMIENGMDSLLPELDGKKLEIRWYRGLALLI